MRKHPDLHVRQTVIFLTARFIQRDYPSEMDLLTIAVVKKRDISIADYA
jgi:hypothetical protein